MREKLDAWLRDGGTIRIVPVGAFGVAALLGIIPMWLEFGTFPAWAPREKIGTPLLCAWIVVFLGTESARRYLARRGARRWEELLKHAELERADQVAGAIDRLCALLVPEGNGQLAPGHIQALLLQGIVDAVRAIAKVDPAINLHASLLVPETRREGRRPVEYLTILSANRLAEGRGWASFRVDGTGPAQRTWADGRVRVVPDTTDERVPDTLMASSYRSIVTLPVTLRCMGGRRLGVVSMDASAPGVFGEDWVRSRLYQAISPQIKLIALSLILTRRTS